MITECSCSVQWNRGMSGNELSDSPGWKWAREVARAPVSEGITMIRKSFGVALSALLFAGALGLASIGPVQAQSIMKQCGDDWKAAKANNTTNGLTWPQFLKQCRTEKEGAATPAAAPAAAPAPAPAPAPLAPAPAPTYQPKPKPMQAARPTGAGQFASEQEAKAPLPRRHGGLGQHQGQVPHLSLFGFALVRHDQAGRLYVRGRRWRRGLPCLEEQDGTAEADVVGPVSAGE